MRCIQGGLVRGYLPTGPIALVAMGALSWGLGNIEEANLAIALPLTNLMGQAAYMVGLAGVVGAAAAVLVWAVTRSGLRDPRAESSVSDMAGAGG